MVGAVLSIVLPWVQTAVLGTRPYLASVFDVASLVGWLLMLIGLGGAYAAFDDQFGPLGRVSVGTTAVGMALVSALLFRRVVLFVDAGFRAVPATGEEPAGLLLSTATVLGLGLTVVGAGGVGLALRRVETRPAVTPWLLLLAPTVPLVVIAVDLLFALPVELGRLLVGSNAVLLPFSLGWLALGAAVLSDARTVG